MGQGAVILGCAGPRPGPEERRLFAAADPWGFILFARNVESACQLADLTADLRDSVGRAAPIFVDQEGGHVARLRPPEFRDWLPPLDFARRAGASAARATWLRHRLIASELQSVGIDANCAPCLDVARPETHPFLRARCYGDGAATVATLGRAAAEGLIAGGVLPVVKHIPGHGAARADSHRELPVVHAPDLTEVDFAPFRALADLPMAMTAHIVYPQLDPERPATTSPACIRAIRERIGFAGLLMTDDISMGALGGTIQARCRAALDAGCDVILHCNGDLAEMRAAVDAAGELSPRSQARTDAALELRRQPDLIDAAALDAELAALLSEAAGV